MKRLFQILAVTMLSATSSELCAQHNGAKAFVEKGQDVPTVVEYHSAQETAEKEQVMSASEKQVPSVVIHLDILPALETNLEQVSVSDLDSGYIGSLTSYSRIVARSAVADSFGYDGHPFINSVRTAYACHRPLVLSPDMLWLVIVRGFGLHVLHNSEKLRHLLVRHEGKKQLVLICEPGLINKPAKNWEPYFSQFTEQISEWVTDSNLVALLTNDFSTTTPTSYVASQIAVMSALQSYFKYTIVDACGIPTIYLEGTPEDWKKLVYKAHQLRRYELDWWMDELEPVLQKIADAAAGEVDPVFWKSICHKKDLPTDDEEYCGLGDPTVMINGWVIKFYPYDNEGNRNTFEGIDNNVVELLPWELSSCPLEYKEVNGNTRELDLTAGLFGITEDSLTKALRPQIVWIITEKNKEENEE